MLQFQIERSLNEARNWLNGQLPKSVLLRWPSKFEIAVRCATAGIPEALGESAGGMMSIYRLSDGKLLAKALRWRRVGQGAAAYYVFFFDLDTDDLSPIFTADATVKTITAVAEIRIVPGDGTDEFVVNDIPLEIRRARMAGDVRIPLPSSATKQSGMMRLGEGLDADAVAFTQEMVGVPVVELTLLTPAGSQLLIPVLEGAPTAEGFAFRLTAETPNGDYWLHWTAEILIDAEGAIIPGNANRARQSLALAQGVQEVPVTFPVALTGAPLLRGLTVQVPVGSPAIFAVPLGLPSAEGFTAWLTDAPANANYKLNYDAQVF